MKTYSPEAADALRKIGSAFGMSCVVEPVNPVQAAICRENASMLLDVFQQCERHGELS